jgi:hypothetical protein
MELRIARNILIGPGAYYLAEWAALPLEIGFGKFTSGIIYRGDFAGYVVMPLVGRLPLALVAAVVGATVILLVESDRPVAWTMIPALIYALVGFYGHHWTRPPVLLDRISETISALFPALTCILGGIIAARWLITQRRFQTNPD